MIINAGNEFWKLCSMHVFRLHNMRTFFPSVPQDSSHLLTFSFVWGVVSPLSSHMTAVLVKIKVNFRAFTADHDCELTPSTFIVMHRCIAEPSNKTFQLMQTYSNTSRRPFVKIFIKAIWRTCRFRLSLDFSQRGIQR